MVGVWRRLFGRSERDALAPLYEHVVAEARRPDWYRAGRVPDTLDGRFDMVAAVLSLVLLRLGRGSTFNDMTYLTRQVNTFACHSWRSYFPSPLPVTILYSELIARMLGNLSTLPQWNPIQLVGRIGEGRWFL